MISLKSLLRNVREAKLTLPKKGVETPLDAKIQIQGYGVMTRKLEFIVFGAQRSVLSAMSIKMVMT